MVNYLTLASTSHCQSNEDDGKTSSFIHVHGEDLDSNRLHIHAAGVPLKLFFESLGIELPKAKVIVNGVETSEGLNYIPKEGDQIEVKF